MKTLARDDGSSIRERVYHYIREQILCGEIAPLEKLVETRIAREIGTSRTPVREALHSLEMEKLIRSVPRVGYVVADLNRDEVEQICEIRGVIEALAARWAIRKSRPRLLKELRRIVARQEKAIAGGNLTSYIDFDAQFHEIIAKLSGSERLLELAQTLRRHMLRYRIQCINVEETALRSLEGHKRILAALEAGDGEAVATMIQGHLDIAKKDILNLVFAEETKDEPFRRKRF
jgi:DNA-binding GntR family transcriptional regulator